MKGNKTVKDFNAVIQIELKPEHDPNLENFHETNFKSVIFLQGNILPLYQ